jgi:orotate phosphoribosyltransferase
MMPGETGLELTTWVRSKAQLSKTPVLLLTARGEASDRIDGLSRGADDYMSKPFDPKAGKNRLLQLVRERAYKDGIDIVLASGKRSTFYINGKKVSLHPEGLWLIAKLLLEKLKKHPEITAVGGLTIGADPLASAVAALSYETGQNLKAFLVRKEAKGHGTGSKIEGDLDKGEKVEILEDTVTTGGSAQKATARTSSCPHGSRTTLKGKLRPEAAVSTALKSDTLWLLLLS